MASSDLRRFNFYQKYLWTPTDFENFETWLVGNLETLFEGLTGAAVLKGLKVTTAGSLQLGVATGIAVNDTGRLVVVSSPLVSSFTAPGSLARWDLLVLRPKLTNMTSIPEPLNPSNTVFLHEQLGYDLVAIPGSVSATPSYPSIVTGDIILCGVRLVTGQTSFATSDIDIGVTDRPRKHKSRVKIATTALTMDGTEEIVELDYSAASGLVNLPAVESIEGLTVRIVKVDSSSNEAVVSGGGVLISGQSSVVLDTQWQTLNIYSNGIAYRMV